MALTGFDCGGTSSQMSSAKVAWQRKDYAAAETALKKEVELRPGNGQAWLMLADIYKEQGRRGEGLNALEKARAATQTKLTPVQIEETYKRQHNLWRESYNAALSAVRNKDFTTAIAHLDTAQRLAPDNAENLYFLGTVYEDMGDNASALRTYQQYVDKVAPVVEMGTKLGLTLQMTPSAVEERLGKPTKAEVSDTLGGYYYYAPQNLYVYFAPATKTRGLAVEGWNPVDASLPEALRTAPRLIRADPYAILGTRAQAAREYDKALRHLQTLSRIDPNREGVSATITQIYIDTKQVDQAIAAIRSEIAANPKDPRPYLDLGNLYFGSERFRDASEAFNNVLSMNLPNDNQHLRIALFNLGAVYKNQGARMQDSIKRLSGGKPTKAQTEAYYAPLRESVRYFERYRAINPTDYIALAELGNLYNVLDDAPKLNAMIKELEGLASANDTTREYWSALSRLYAFVGDEKKAVDADRRAEALR
jgi:Flp pilus assembly protein TadD